MADLCAAAGAAARPAKSRWAPLAVAGAAAGGVLAAMIIAHAMAHGALVHPGCGWKWLTGIPCPGCGGTRSLAALGEGDWLAALNWNPFVALGAVATWVAVPLTWLDIATNDARGTAFVRRLVRTRGFHGGAIALLILNWIWLCLGGR